MRVRSFSTVASDVLVSLYQHRLLSTPQLRALHTPNAKSGLRMMQRAIKEHLLTHDPPLVDAVGTAERTPTNLWFLTEAGLDAVESSPRLEHRRVQVTAEAAAGPLQAHTLAVNDVGVAFVTAARERGDECGPLAWRHEIAHPIGPGGGRGAKGGDVVIADALLRYAMFRRNGVVDLMSRFIELDRATMPMEDLAAKLRRYARLWAYVPDGSDTPGWQALYPQAFPEVLVVFAGKPRAVLERRMHTVLALAAGDGQIMAGKDHLVIACALLEDLAVRGPFAAVFHRHDRRGEQVDWLGQGADADVRRAGAQGCLLP